MPSNAVITDSGSLQLELSLTGADESMFYFITPPEDADDHVIFSGLIGNTAIEGDKELAPPGDFLGNFDNYINDSVNSFSYDKENDIYEFVAKNDNTVLLYKEMHGDFVFRARIDYEEDPGGWTWAYISAQNSPTFTISPIGWFIHYSNGQADAGGEYSERINEGYHDKWFEIARTGSTFTISYFHPIQQEWLTKSTVESTAGDLVYVEIGVGTYAEQAIVHFSDVEIITSSATKNWALY